MQDDKKPLNTEGDNRSEVEKLMSEHLRNPDHQISDEQLDSIKVGVPAGNAAPTSKTDEDKEEEGPAQATPWDVLGG